VYVSKLITMFPSSFFFPKGFLILILDDKPSNPSVLIKEIRLALSHLLNLLRLPESERVNSEYFLSFKEVIARIPQLEKYYFYEALSLNNSTAYAIKQVLINLPEYSR